jgi:hypothetical protein
MADIINLRMARKAVARTRDAQTAAANRAKFGATKGERQVRAMEEKRLARTIDGAKLDGETD